MGLRQSRGERVYAQRSLPADLPYRRGQQRLPHRVRKAECYSSWWAQCKQMCVFVSFLGGRPVRARYAAGVLTLQSCPLARSFFMETACAGAWAARREHMPQIFLLWSRLDLVASL